MRNGKAFWSSVRLNRKKQALKPTRVRLQSEKLEDRCLMTIAPLFPAEALDAVREMAAAQEQSPEPIAESFGVNDELLAQYDALRASDPRVAIDLSQHTGDQLRIPIEVGGETQTLVLERNVSTRSSSFQVLLQQDDGSLVEFELEEERNYVGYVEERPGIQVSAVISSRGLTAEAFQLSGEFVWDISPVDEVDEQGVALHAVSSSDVLALLDFSHDHDGDGIADHAAGEHVDNQPGGGHGPGCTCAACTGAQSDSEQGFTAASLSSIPTLAGDSETQQDGEEPEVLPLIEPNTPGFFNPSDAFREGIDPPDVFGPADRSSRAVLFNPVQVREAVVGFDVTNESFREAYNNNVQAVLDNISQFLNTNERVFSGTDSPNVLWLRDAAIRQVAGTIIIRTSVEADPYTAADGIDDDDVDIDGSVLNAFRDRWNANLDTGGGDFFQDGTRLQSNHDLATLLGGGDTNDGADGLAFVGTVGQTSRYSISDGSRVGFWRAVARHELGHTWGLTHSFGRAESDGGGNGIGIQPSRGGLMNRLTTDEIIRITQEADESSSNLSVIDSPVGVPTGTFTDFNARPHATRDDVQAFGSAPIVIDVLANDFDVNNDALFLDRHDSVSENGGQISISIGTGDQGQDELIYTPPEGFVGTDLFYYFAGDVPQFGEGIFGNPWTAYGIVTIEVVSTDIAIDPLDTNLNFDFGPADGAVLNSTGFDGIEVSPFTQGDVFFTRNGQPVAPGEIGVFDRGSQPGVNAANRDAIIGTEPLTVNFVVPNGAYNVLLNLADPDATRDNQTVRVEGELRLPDVDNPVGTNVTQTISNVEVIDGVLSLEIDDLGGINNEFALNRVTLNRTVTFADPPLLGDLDSSNLVNAADFVLARDTIGLTVANPFDGLDHDGSGVVDIGDIQVVQANFGNTITTTALIGGDLRNGNFNDLTPNTGADDGQFQPERGRVLRSGSGQVTIPNWVISRLELAGGNGAFGTDGLMPLGNDGGNGQPIDPVVFVNNDTIQVETSSSVPFDGSEGDEISLSYDLATDVDNDSPAIVQATLTFDAGTSNQFIRTFTQRSVSFADGATRFSETLRLPRDFSNVSISFELGQLNTGGPGVQRSLLDDVVLEVTSITNTAATPVLTASSQPDSEEVAAIVEVGEPEIQPILIVSGPLQSPARAAAAEAAIAESPQASLEAQELLAAAEIALAEEGDRLERVGDFDGGTDSSEAADLAFGSLDELGLDIDLG